MEPAHGIEFSASTAYINLQSAYNPKWYMGFGPHTAKGNFFFLFFGYFPRKSDLKVKLISKSLF